MIWSPLHREGRHQRADFAGLGGIGGADALAATARNPEFVARGTLAVSLFGHRQDVLFARLELLIALIAEIAGFARFFANQRDILDLGCILARRPALSHSALEVGRALGRIGVDMVHDRH
jgi:hypothetical protein